jgi:hypothetical protein
MKKMKFEKLKTVETVEEFRNTLLKVFYSNQEKRELLIKYKLGKYESDFLSVDEFNSFKDIKELSDLNVYLTPKVDSEFFLSNYPQYLYDLDDLMDIDIYEDEEEFLNVKKTPVWVPLSDINLMFLIENLFHWSFLP